MKVLDVQARLECAAAAVAVLRALKIADKTMRYGAFAKVIGLMSGEVKSKPWHRRQISDILYLLSATQRQVGRNTGIEALQFERIVNEKGRPGVGFAKRSKIVKEKPSTI
jgi:hypothetical protein